MQIIYHFTRNVKREENGIGYAKENESREVEDFPAQTVDKLA